MSATTGAAIRESDAKAMLSLVSGLGTSDDPDEFRSELLPGLRELVPCDIAAYNEIHREPESLVALTDPVDVIPPGGVETFARLSGENVLVEHYQRTRDGRPYKWSDFITRRELHRSRLYTELFKGMGVEYQMAFGLPAPPEVVIGLTVNRGRKDFDDRDRTVLNLVRAPLVQTYAAVRRYAALAARMRALERGLERSGGGVVVLSPGGTTADFISDDAAQALGVGAGPDGGALPAAVTRWLAAAGEGRSERAGGLPPLILDSPGEAQVAVHFLPGRRDGDSDALLVERSGELLSAEDLRGAGLTQRQAEVLRLVARGATNAEIAAELTISPRTVHKHLENIYEMLGASSRTQAVLAAWSVAKSGDPGQAIL